MAKQTALKPWHEVVELREDLKSGDLSLAVFAADLYDVVMQRGRRPVYEDPKEFFAFSYPTLSLRELVRDVSRRLAGQSDRAYRKLSVNYGGGKTHSLITLWHLVQDPDGLPDLPTVDAFARHSGLKPPKARVAALCFDKIDMEKGIEAKAPNGTTRTLLHPWSVLAFQLAGADGLRLIHGEGLDAERKTPPAEPILVELLSLPQKDGLATLVLLDEVLLYLRGLKASNSSGSTHLVNFFHYLTQAVVKVDRCAMVASLLASDKTTDDDFRGDFGEIHEVFGRMMEEEVSPVSKEDVAEVLRRRFFTPESIRDRDSFRPHVASAVGNIADMDEQTRRERQLAEDRFLDSYPFHPDLTDLFYTRWTQMDGFQRTRGILRTYAIALRDARQWDTGPLVGPNVFLNEDGKNELSEAARELASFATINPTGANQRWQPILEGELDKARAIQSQEVGLRYRELEQAVMSVFLSSQPIGQKAQTRDLNVLVGASKPDRIEFERGLLRWTESSWFLDEDEVSSAPTTPDGSRQLPAAWRLGNRPNLKQMHDEACENRVPTAQVETTLLQRISQLRSLTQEASATGARVHTLPDRPSDIPDDGEFHYAVLKPSAASESGKPSPEAKRFIDETTGQDRPRVNRNAIVLAVPSRDGLEIAKNRIREYLGWREVEAILKRQYEADPESQSDESVSYRQQMLDKYVGSADREIPSAIRQAYSIVVTANESNDIQAFKIAVANEPLFNTIKNDGKARIQGTSIRPDSMLVGGPYGLWQEDETFRLVSHLVGAFAQNAKLPKMLDQKAIRDTVARGVQEGIWVGRLCRPDDSAKTYWRSEIGEDILREPALEVWLPEAVSLSDLDPELLKPHELPGLWNDDEISVQDMINYFSTGHQETVQREGYEDVVLIPQCEEKLVQETIGRAVETRLLWLTNGSVSVFGEPVPQGTLGGSARLQAPPVPIGPQQLVAAAIPDAWQNDQANVAVISDTISSLTGKPVPWPILKEAIYAGLQARWFELSGESGPWPCDLSGARTVVIKAPGKEFVPHPEPTGGALTAEASLEANGIQDLADQVHSIVRAAAGNNLKFNVRIELGGNTPPPADVVSEINALLSQISDGLQFQQAP